MPLYEFSCAECGPFTELRRVSECDLPAACPACGTPAPRMISVPRLAIMTANNRKAWERNETSAHEPRHVQAGRRHGHSHGRQDTEKHHHQHKHSHKHVHNGRPWMLGH
jgi:putative FmdB family regulatory protein